MRSFVQSEKCLYVSKQEIQKVADFLQDIWLPEYHRHYLECGEHNYPIMWWGNAGRNSGVPSLAITLDVPVHSIMSNRLFHSQVRCDLDWMVFRTLAGPAITKGIACALISRHILRVGVGIAPSKIHEWGGMRDFVDGLRGWGIAVDIVDLPREQVEYPMFLNVGPLDYHLIKNLFSQHLLFSPLSHPFSPDLEEEHVERWRLTALWNSNRYEVVGGRSFKSDISLSDSTPLIFYA